MPRKRHYDLREFWPWYERQWPTRGGLHAVKPPFTLQDIGQKEPATPGEKRLGRAMSIFFAVFAVSVVLWALIFG